MISQAPRVITAVFVISTSLALGACANAPSDFDDDNAADDDSSVSSGGGSTSSSASASTGTSSAGGGGATSSSMASTSATTGATGGGGNPNTSGETCADAADLTGAVVSLGGNYTDSQMSAGSCDPTADNVAWFSYTASATGLYDFSFTNNSAIQAFSRLAVFEGASCAPLGAEVACESAAGLSVNSLIQLDAGTTYTIMFYTDGPGYPMENPVASISSSAAGPGSVCALADDLSAATFPYTLTGSFSEDPLSLGSCAAAPTNVAWFKYTATTTDKYKIEATNQSNSGAWSRLVVMQSDSCAPYGSELACETSTSSAIDTEIDMVAGLSYLIGFHTDGDNYAMVNPVMNVEVKGPPPPGGACDSAVSATGQAFPFQLLGNFEDDPSTVSPTCDTAVTNAAWFSYSPPTTGWFDLSLVNNTTDTAFSRVAVFEGAICAPVGVEIACEKSFSSTLDTADSIQMQAGLTYTILFWTDGDSYGMQDPELSVTMGAAPPPGDSCDVAVDVTGATFPYTEIGSYTKDPAFGGTCDTDATNTAWFSYTPAASGWYQVDGTNGSATVSPTRVVVVEGNSCATIGTQVGCMIGAAATASETSWLLGGQSYLIAVYSSSSTNPMDDPSIAITAVAAPATGLVCEIADNVSGATFPYSLTGEFDDDDYAGSSCDLTPNNVVWYRFTPTVTQAYTIDAVNATTTFAYSRLAIFQGNSCNPFGTEVDCASNSAKDAQIANVTLTAGVEYLIAFHTDGETYTMVDPQLTITP